ncbi:MAG: hypothetical protein PHG34_09240 [Candidatus Cloacimonetes bacterium]|nr:hypothetical protein [Candidatus Cloacimonadota bacterium]
MKQDALPISKEIYNEIVAYVIDMVQSNFENLNISKDAANCALIRFLNAPPSTDDAIVQVLAMYSKVIEELFASYHKIAFQYCLQKAQNPELSNDIAQETICCLLKSQNRIDEITNWVKSVAHNLLCEHYRTEKDEQALYQDLQIEGELIRQLSNNSSKIGLAECLHVVPESILHNQNYKSYSKLKEYDSLQAYAEANKLGYEAAKSKSKKLIKNLKAEILLAMGWQASPDILDYNQYKAIQSFIRKLLALSTATKEGTSEALSKLHPDLPQVLTGYTSVEDWGITMISERRFRLYLYHLSSEQAHLMATIFINIGKRNHVQVENCKINKYAGSHNISAKAHIPKQMGAALWSYEKIISLLNENSR